MKFKDNRLVAINVVAGALVLGGFATFIKTTFARPNVEVCTSRYNRGTTMRFDDNGAPLSSVALQSAANGHDRGMMENVMIDRTSQPSLPFAMTVDISGVKTPDNGVPFPGVEFPWSPQSLQGVESGCLSYSVFIPKDFKLPDRIALPGFFSVADNDDYSARYRIDTRVALIHSGNLQMRIYAKSKSGSADAIYEPYDRVFPRGRWVRIDQEVILNEIGKQDGVARMWFDGDLQVEVKGADLRETKDVYLSGVAAIVRRFGNLPDQSEAKKAKVQLSPFELRWNARPSSS